MINSIKYFEEKSISKFEKLQGVFLESPSDIASYVLELTEELHKWGLMVIQESLEQLDQLYVKSSRRKEKWSIERSGVEKQLITSLGTVQFKKTLFVNKETGKSEFLVDRALGLEKHERMTEDAEAKMLEEAVQTSYRRGGEESSLMSEVSKQTVKNKLHRLKFPENAEQPKGKKKVDYLYIDADEDHVSLQFREEKGDLTENENHQKNNCLLTKIAYVYEGIEREAPKSKRNKLVNPHYFCGTGKVETNEAFWDNVYQYIETHYEINRIKQIYLNSDGGAWIKAGMKRISGMTHVLDEFHISKYLIKLTSHMGDTREDARSVLREVIRKGTKKEFVEKVELLKNDLLPAGREEKLEEYKKYILDNWTPAKLRLRHQDGVKGSSTEAHVSHILSSRMSSRPMGWSSLGAHKMAQLRAYYKNGGSMLELVHFQKEELKEVSGGTEVVLSAAEVLASERKNHGEVGKYMKTIQHEASDKISHLSWYQAIINGGFSK